MKQPVHQYRRGGKLIIVYDDDSIEECDYETRDIVSSICPECLKIECICDKK